MRPGFKVSIAIAAACGLAVSSGFVAGLASAGLFPVAVILQNHRGRAFRVAFAYYVGATWSIVPICRNYFESEAGIPTGLLFWASASGLLALPWFWAWHANRRASVWRTPVATLLSVFPPLGIIGWANPVISAGILLPGAGWWGLLLTLLLPGMLINWRLRCAVAFFIAVLLMNASYRTAPTPPSGWNSVNTEYGNLAGSFLAEYSVATGLCRYVNSSTANVLLFPEGTAPRWSEASVRFWRQCLTNSSVRALLLGAQIQTPRQSDPGFSVFELGSALDALEGNALVSPSKRRSGTGYRNVLVVIASHSAVVYDQHIPVPIAMWKPLGNRGVSMDWRPNTPVLIAGQRVCVLVCYEALISWPIISTMVNRPGVMVAIANDHWSGLSTAPLAQIAFLSSWSRLFQVPFLRAANQ
jgi:hypothetical protein